MYCRNCGKEIDDKAEVCINCGVFTKSNEPMGSLEKVCWGLLGFFIPVIISLILYLLLKNSRHDIAKMIGFGSLVKIGLYFSVIILYLCLFVLLGGLIFL